MTKTNLKPYQEYLTDIINQKQSSLKQFQSQDNFAIERTENMLLDEWIIKLAQDICYDIQANQDEKEINIIEFYISNWERDVFNCRWKPRSSSPWENLKTQLKFEAIAYLLKHFKAKSRTKV